MFLVFIFKRKTQSATDLHWIAVYHRKHSFSRGPLEIDRINTITVLGENKNYLLPKNHKNNII